MQSFDVVIIGGGMTGLSLACGLNGCGIKIAIIENSPPENLKNEFNLHQIDAFRVFAINVASQKLFEYLGVWKKIIEKKVVSYQNIKVWQKDSFGYINFNAKEYSLPTLGYVIENSVIRDCLWKQAKSSGDITFLIQNKLEKIVWGENEVFITFDNKEMLKARLVVGADGSKSWLREKADIPVIFLEYEHVALVATIRTDLSHMYIARQCFYKNSILAILPLQDPCVCSIVWSLPPRKAHRNLELEVFSFEKELSAALDLKLGFCRLISERYIFPLIGQYAQNFAGQRIVLIGDAAHTIHPLAGQGVNLGLMDVAELIGEIRNLNALGKDIGQYFYLQSYERKRKYTAILMLASMRGLQKLLSGTNSIKKIISDFGLLLINKMPCIKEKLLHYALGSSDMPEWLKKISNNSSEII